MIPFTAVWYYPNGAYVNDTSEAGSSGGTAFNFISDTGANSHYRYLGFRDKFKGFIHDVATAGSYGARTYEYWDGENWTVFVPLMTADFTVDRYVLWGEGDLNNWIPAAFTSTWPHSQAPPDNVKRYWIRVSVASVTTIATLNQILSIPRTVYTSAEKVAQFLQIKSDFTKDSKPSIDHVENLILRAEGRIDYRTRKSWRWNVEHVQYDDPNQIFDYNRYGIPLRKYPIQQVYSASIWSGSSDMALTEGRNNDFFVDHANGILYFTRLFLLPAAYGMTGRYFHWGFGEFKRSIRVHYTWGRNHRLDPQFPIVEDIATKMAAVDLLTTHDYSVLISSGTDKIPLADKVRYWNEEIEAKLDELQAAVWW